MSFAGEIVVSPSWHVGGAELRGLATMYKLWADARGDGVTALSEADHAARMYRVTGTRASKIWCGQESAAIDDMMGRCAPFGGSLATALGHTNEPHAAWWVCRMAGWHPLRLSLQPTLISPQYVDADTGYSWASVSPDAIVVTEGGEKVCLEFKNSTKVDEWGDSGEGYAGVAKRYQGQVLWQRHLLGVSEVWVVLCYATQMRIYRVPEHPRREKELVDKCRRVWEENIKAEVVKSHANT
jgi:hypothetical protein